MREGESAEDVVDGARTGEEGGDGAGERNGARELKAGEGRQRSPGWRKMKKGKADRELNKPGSVRLVQSVFITPATGAKYFLFLLCKRWAEGYWAS